MAVMAVNPGDGSTQSPRNLTATAMRTNGQNPSADWWSKYISAYNKPPVSAADFYNVSSAAKTNAEIIAEAQARAERARFEQEAAQARLRTPSQEVAAAVAEEQQYESTWGPLDFLRTGAMAAAGAAADWMSQPIMTPEQQATLVSERKAKQALVASGEEAILGQLEELTTPTPENMVKNASVFESRNIPYEPVRRGGKIVGYAPTGEYAQTVAPTITPQMVTVSDAEAASQNGVGGGAFDPRVRRGVGGMTINDEIVALEQSFAARKHNAAVQAWGEPIEVTNPDGSKKLQWGSNGMEYLGMKPGMVAAPTLNRPAADAPYKEQVKYRDRLMAQQQTLVRPMYKEADTVTEFYNMGTKGIKDTQKLFLKAHMYETNDPISFGNIGEKEIGFMKKLMTYANINGTTWQEQLSLAIAHAQNKEKSGWGGGGGGGGGTSVYTQIQYNQTSLAQGRALLISVLKDALGRYPTDTEVAQFMDMLNKAESKSPTRTVTRTTKEGKNTTSVARMTPSTVDTQQMAEEFAQGIGGGAPAEANMNDRYIGALLKSLGGTSV